MHFLSTKIRALIASAEVFECFIQLYNASVNSSNTPPLLPPGPTIGHKRYFFQKHFKLPGKKVSLHLSNSLNVFL